MPVGTTGPRVSSYSEKPYLRSADGPPVGRKQGKKRKKGRIKVKRLVRDMRPGGTQKFRKKKKTAAR